MTDILCVVLSAPFFGFAIWMAAFMLLYDDDAPPGGGSDEEAKKIQRELLEAQQELNRLAMEAAAELVHATLEEMVRQNQ